MILHVRTAIDSDSVRERVREEVWRADTSVPQFEVHTLAEEVDAVLVQERLVAMLSTCLGVGNRLVRGARATVSLVPS